MFFNFKENGRWRKIYGGAISYLNYGVYECLRIKMLNQFRLGYI